MENENLDKYSMDVECFEALPKRAKELIFKNWNKVNRETLLDIFICTEDLKSPIEKILFTILLININYYKMGIFVDYQREIKINDKNYIADFIIEYDDNVNNFLKKDFKLVIECDGYEFHKKTKEQVDYDNQRDYDMKVNGYEVLRFSGTEVYNNPEKCFFKIIKFIAKRGIKNDK